MYKESIEPNLEAGNMLMFAHGFNIHFNQIVPPADVDVTMIAPKATGTYGTQRVSGRKRCSLFGSSTSGCNRKSSGACTCLLPCNWWCKSRRFETTFRTETETDLFGEQAVLCGGVCALMQAVLKLW